MAKKSIKRIEADIQFALSNIIREMKDPRITTMLSIVRLEVTGDLSYATVYISSMNGFEEAKIAVEALNKAAGFIRREVAAKVEMRKSPAMKFIADDSIEYSAKLSEKFNKIKKKDENKDEDKDED